MTKFENASPADELRPNDRHGQVEAEVDRDESDLRAIVTVVAWLVGFACARRTVLGVDGALAEADSVAEHLAIRLGWHK